MASFIGEGLLREVGADAAAYFSAVEFARLPRLLNDLAPDPKALFAQLTQRQGRVEIEVGVLTRAAIIHLTLTKEGGLTVVTQPLARVSQVVSTFPPTNVGGSLQIVGMSNALLLYRAATERERAGLAEFTLAVHQAVAGA